MKGDKLMKLKDLKDIIYSSRDGIQSTIVYDAKTFEDIEFGCSIEFAIMMYGDKTIKRIMADNGGYLVIGIE